MTPKWHVRRQEAEAEPEAGAAAEEAPKKKKKKSERYFDGAPADATNGTDADAEQTEQPVKVRTNSSAPAVITL